MRKQTRFCRSSYARVTTNIWVTRAGGVYRQRSIMPLIRSMLWGERKTSRYLFSIGEALVPLRDVIKLTPAARRVVSFILVPPEIGRPLQKDSPFPEVLALNAAARRAKGAYIGRIDQDTLVGKRFLEAFLGAVEGSQAIELPTKPAMFFANVRMVPYRFTVRCPPLWMVERYIERMCSKLPLEIGKHAPFYCASVGIWLLPQVMWHECGGYDESMLYMNSMEIDNDWPRDC